MLTNILTLRVIYSGMYLLKKILTEAHSLGTSHQCADKELNSEQRQWTYTFLLGTVEHRTSTGGSDITEIRHDKTADNEARENIM